jgi:hypothetical protein
VRTTDSPVLRTEIADKALIHIGAENATTELRVKPPADGPLLDCPRRARLPMAAIVLVGSRSRWCLRISGRRGRLQPLGAIPSRTPSEMLQRTPTRPSCLLDREIADDNDADQAALSTTAGGGSGARS